MKANINLGSLFWSAIILIILNWFNVFSLSSFVQVLVWVAAISALILAGVFAFVSVLNENKHKRL